MDREPAQFLNGPNGRIAFRRREALGSDGGKPGIVWLGGFRSDMLGTKAAALDEWAARNDRAFLRFDYTGHGESDGRFEDGVISQWRDDALAVLDGLTDGPQILVGSSMGAWIATLVARARPARLFAALFIAPAPDFTERLMWPAFTEAQRETLLATGRLEQPSEFADEPEVITRALIEDGRANLVMDGPIPIAAPVRILQGMKDASVPWRHALDFAALIESEDVDVTLSKSGDHRLSTQGDLDRLVRTLEGLA